MTKQEGRGVVGGEGQEEQKLKKHTKLIIWLFADNSLTEEIWLKNKTARVLAKGSFFGFGKYLSGKSVQRVFNETRYLLLPPSAEITFLPTFYFAANGSHIYLMQIASCAKVK